MELIILLHSYPINRLLADVIPQELVMYTACKVVYSLKKFEFIIKGT